MDDSAEIAYGECVTASATDGLAVSEDMSMDGCEWCDEPIVDEKRTATDLDGVQHTYHPACHIVAEAWFAAK